LKQGEIRKRLDMPAGALFPVMVLSGEAYNKAAKGRVVLCPVVPGVSAGDYATVHRVSYADNGTDTIGLAIPEMIFWLPVSALSEPIGFSKDMRPVLDTVQALFT
jgi:mRNA-degrading endonuclease toxin of MazEF toxin-antitoxin module